jgi:nitrate/nitrite transport system substrate-binding protein
VYKVAAQALLKEGKIKKEDTPWNTDGYRPPSKEFIDGIEYDGKKPVEYLSKLKIGHKDPIN